MPDLSFLETAMFWKYASMPFISGLIGYITNQAAIYMMFHPIEFIGVWKPFGGWQGIVPRKAAKMAAIAIDTILENLVDSEEIFGRLQPEEIARRLEGPLHDMVPDLVNEVMSTHHPEVWARTPQAARDGAVARIRATIPEAVEEVVEDLRENVTQVFDLKHMVLTRLVYDKPLLNRIFLETGDKEFTFIARSGFYFGFPLGMIQMFIWIFYQPFWLLPAVGMFVGWFTNWSALKMIFNPKNKHKVGPFEIHGLFFKRQKDVARAYSRLIADQVLAPANILKQVLKGPYSDRIFSVVAHRVGSAIDESAGIAQPFVSWSVGDDNYLRLKETAVRRLMETTPDVDANRSETTQEFIDHIDESFDIETTLVERMEKLDPEKFEGMLRPAFEEDEWILIAVGAALGFAVGLGQFLILFGGGGG